MNSVFDGTSWIVCLVTTVDVYVYGCLGGLLRRQRQVWAFKEKSLSEIAMAFVQIERTLVIPMKIVKYFI